ncbi:MAG: GTP cyclohydrolase II [Thalassobaculales bacterium]
MDPTALLHRALADFRRGAPVLVTNRARAYAAVAIAAEVMQPDSLASLVRLAGSAPVLALTPPRARALGGSGEGLRTLSLPPGADEALVRALADPTMAGSALADPAATLPPGISVIRAWADGVAGGAIGLCKRARLLPAALLALVDLRDGPAVEGFCREHGLIAVDAAEIAGAARLAAGRLRPAASARVPLADAADARIVAFRPPDGGVEHLAILVGQPEAEAAAGRPVLARLHSQCFTGDLLGSLRCDCGDQLRGALKALAAAGHGVLLYLAQEGRDIGLVNKLRAYQLQDGGLDTIDANLHLGFEADERDFEPAAAMLRALGITSVRLMTNNPEKVAGLEACGIAVAERVPHAFAANPHNAAYLAAKRARAGHLF